MSEKIQKGLMAFALMLTFTLIMLTAGIVGAYSKPMKYNTKMPVVCMPTQYVKANLAKAKQDLVAYGEVVNGFRPGLFVNKVSGLFAFVVFNVTDDFGCFVASGSNWKNAPL